MNQATKLAELSRQMAKDPGLAETLDEETSAQLRAHLNPLATVTNAENEKFVNLSIVNMKDKDMSRIHMTALIGYLFRTLEEYDPEDETGPMRAVMRKEMSECKNLAQTNKVRIAHENKINAHIKKRRNDIEKFLNRNFKFNPDRHVREAHSRNPADTERKLKSQLTKEQEERAKKVKTVQEQLNSRPEETFKLVKENLKASYQYAIKLSEYTSSIIKVLTEAGLDENALGVLYKKYGHIVQLANEMKVVADPFMAAATMKGLKISPPADVFHHYDRYLRNHYSEIRTIVECVYGAKFDLEFMVAFYDVFPTEAAAEEHKRQKFSEFRLEVTTVSNQGLTVLGPFRENRDRESYYSAKTEVLQGMAESIKNDQKLGEDILIKGQKIKKMKNIDEAGLDEKGLAEYAKVNNTVKDLGAKQSMTREEQEEYARAKDIKEAMEVPPGAIRSAMFIPGTDDAGEPTLERKIIYSQSEAPHHLEKDSIYAQQYQPVRDNPVTDITPQQIVPGSMPMLGAQTLGQSPAEISKKESSKK